MFQVEVCKIQSCLELFCCLLHFLLGFSFFIDLCDVYHFLLTQLLIMVVHNVDAEHPVICLEAPFHQRVVCIENALHHFSFIAASLRNLLNQLEEPNCVNEKTFLKASTLFGGYAKRRHGVHVYVQYLSGPHHYILIKFLSLWLLGTVLEVNCQDFVYPVLHHHSRHSCGREFFSRSY